MKNISEREESKNQLKDFSGKMLVKNFFAQKIFEGNEK